jgi:hypothetical protein
MRLKLVGRIATGHALFMSFPKRIYLGAEKINEVHCLRSCLSLPLRLCFKKALRWNAGGLSAALR